MEANSASFLLFFVELLHTCVTMHPTIASFLVEHLLGERPALRTLRHAAPNISFAAPKFSEATNAKNPERRRWASRSPKTPRSVVTAPRGDKQ